MRADDDALNDLAAGVDALSVQAPGGLHRLGDIHRERAFVLQVCTLSLAYGAL